MFISICRKTRKNLHQQIKEKDDKQVFYVYEVLKPKIEKQLEKLPKSQTMLSLLLPSDVQPLVLIFVNLHNIIFASPSKSRIRNLQSIGRV